MKNSLKKVTLLCAALATSMSSFAISTGGAVAAGLGAAAAVTLLGVGIHKSRKHKDEKQYNKNNKKSYDNRTQLDDNKTKRATKRDIKKEINDTKRQRKQTLTNLHKKEKLGQGNTAQANKYRSRLDELDQKIEKLKMDLERVL